MGSTYHKGRGSFTTKGDGTCLPPLRGGAARLFINEYFALEPGLEQDRLARLVEDLQAAGAPLHGIGFQGHVNFLPGVNPTRVVLRSAASRPSARRPRSGLNVHGASRANRRYSETQRRFWAWSRTSP
jgi:GH35 family endo-1,4-beta-xylanase